MVKYLKRFAASPMPLQYTNGFKTASLKMNHYNRHIVIDGDFACASADEYEEMADEFCGKPLTPDIRVYTRNYGIRAGSVIRWDTTTNEWGVVTNDGYISTYFKLNSLHCTNEDYFQMQIDKDTP